jgi:hypothetical protein
VIEISHTVDAGMIKTFLSRIEEYFGMKSLIDPMPRALIDNPPTPVTVLSTMRCRVKKSDLSGEI